MVTIIGHNGNIRLGGVLKKELVSSRDEGKVYEIFCEKGSFLINNKDLKKIKKLVRL